MMNYVCNMNADLTMTCIGFAILAVGSCIVITFKAWQTLTLGERCLAGEGEPDSEELSFRIFCYEMFQEPALSFINRTGSLLKSLCPLRAATAVSAVS